MYFYDENLTRYQLVKSNPGEKMFNWIFLPGGPGVDSCYLMNLLKNLTVPGNLWLIDLPGNGSNLSDRIKTESDFDTWSEYLLTALQKFERPVYIGHSFGGMFPLLFPQLENILKGFVILNSAPSLWLEAAAKCAKENNLPSLEALEEFTANSNPENFKLALFACAPYYFRPEYIEQGKVVLEQTPNNYVAASWWLKKSIELNFNAKWIPQNVPTLIIGGSHDYIVPFHLFENDSRFNRENITFKRVENSGHIPWLEQMPIVVKTFKDFCDRI